jgi:thiol:disulfide interchange protein DsbD
MKNIVTLFLIVFCAYSINAQAPKVIINAQPEKTNVTKGETFNIRIQVTLPSPWYTYDIKEQIGPDGIGPSTTLISFEPEGLLAVNEGKIKTSKPLKKYDKEFEMDVRYFKKSFELNVPVKANKNIDFSKEKFIAVVDMQLCNETACLPPEYYKGAVSSTAYQTENIDAESQPAVEESIDTAVKEEITPAIEVTQTTLKTETQSEIENKKEEGFFAFLWLAMIMGALSLLTPCVFPMIPITVSFFTKRAEKQKTNPLKDASIYAIGIIFTFTLLGFLLAILFGATAIGDFASNGWVNLFIVAIFVIFALNLFGAFELQLPSGLMNKLDAKSS